MPIPLLALAGAQALGKGIAGYGAYKSAKETAGSLVAQGELLLSESKADAILIREEANRFAQNQKLQYLSSGVGFGGSALVTIASTKYYGEQEAKAVEKRGAAEFEKYRMQARQIKKKGTMDLVSGIVSGGLDIAGAMK